MTIEIIDYQPQYSRETVTMWRASKEAALGIKDIHTLDEFESFLNGPLLEDCRVLLALKTDAGSPIVAGIMAFNSHAIEQLYIHVDYQNLGIGLTLLNIAKSQCHGNLQLYTFEINLKAQRFYERHGFKIIARSNGDDNEEQLPDILYEWKKQP